MRALAMFFVLAFTGCAPQYRYVMHSGKNPEANMCQMQAQRARDYCVGGKKRCDPNAIKGKKCVECWEEYREAFVTCGGAVDKVCVKHCDKVEDVKLENQTQD